MLRLKTACIGKKVLIKNPGSLVPFGCKASERYGVIIKYADLKELLS